MDTSDSITCRKFQLTLISASNLPSIRKYFKMKVYAKVSFNGNEKTIKKTPVDKHNLTNPAWNCSLDYTIAEVGLQHSGLMLVIKLYSKQKLGDQYIGEVHTSVRDLFNNAYSQGLSARLSLPLQEGSAPIPNSVLQIGYRFGEPIEVRKPALWERVLKSGAVVLFRATMVATLGVDVEVPIYKEPHVIGSFK